MNTKKKVVKKKVSKKKTSTKKTNTKKTGLKKNLKKSSKKVKRKAKSKPRPKKRPRSKKQRKKSSANFFRSRLIKFIVLLVLFGLIAAAIFTVKSYKEIQVKFDGVRWALPARVYARPLELYAGQDMSKEQLGYEIDLLGYQLSQSNSLKPGFYRRNGSGIDVYTKQFTFSDGQKESCLCRVTVGVNGIVDIVNLKTNKPHSILRFEPYHYASIYPLLKEDRDVVSLDDVPADLVDLLLAVEDADYYKHFGVKPSSILRALIANIKAGKTVQGGSTLTQQLVKNFFLTRERSLSRKAHEAFISILLELRYEKNEILEAYLNEVFLGQQKERAIHGFALASRHYYNRPLKNLDYDEMATLVGMIKGPSFYNPFTRPEETLKRRNIVLGLANKAGYISSVELAQYKGKKLSVSSSRSTQTLYPAYLGFMKSQLGESFSKEALSSEGLRVFSSLDPYVQHVTEKAVKRHLSQVERNKNFKPGSLQAAAVVVDTSNAEIVAMLGDSNPRFTGFNRAVNAKRHVGSLLKPFVYLEAFSREGMYTPASMIEDRFIQLEYDNKTWSPQNYDKKFNGPTPLYKALAKSYNAAAVELGIDLGLESVLKRISKIAPKVEMPQYPSVLLGAVGLSPLEVASLYLPLANQGYRSEFRAVQTVLLPSDERIQAYPLKVKRVMDSDINYQINYLLQTVVKEGTAKRLSNKHSSLNLAAKTGTSNNLRDSWLVAYSGKHLIVVWVGKDNNQSSGLTGSSGALPIVDTIFDKINTRALTQVKPKNIDFYAVDRSSGRISRPKCDNTIILPFITGTQPKEVAECKGLSLLQRLFD